MKKRILREEKAASVLGRAFDFPAECFGGGSLEIFGGCEMTLTGCTRIAEYSPVLVRLETKEMLLKIEGEDLLLSSLANGAVEVLGRIDSVVFERL